MFKECVCMGKVAPMCVDALHVSLQHTAVCVTISAAAPVRH